MGIRERYLREGPSAFSDAELVAVILETGIRGRSAVQIATEWVEQGGSLRALARMEPLQWVGVAGIGRARAVRVHAALALARRIDRTEPSGTVPVSGPQEAFAVLGPALFDLPHEELHALFLDRKNRPLAHRKLTSGSDALTVVEPRQVFRVAIGVGAVGVVLAHNHPSGDPTPSAEDRAITERVARAGQIVGVSLLDHLVIGGRSFVSLGQGTGPALRPPAWTG